MVLYLCVLIVFSLHRESLKLILAMIPSPRWFCHGRSPIKKTPQLQHSTFRLPHATRLENNLEASLFLSIVIVVLCSNQTSPCLKIDSCFLFCFWKLLLAPLCNDHSCCSSYQSKAHKYSLEIWEGYLHVGIQSFMTFHFKFWSKFIIVSSLPSVQHKIPAAFVKFYKAYLLSHWSYEDVWRPIGK
jgi:hypothetical protein